MGQPFTISDAKLSSAVVVFSHDLQIELLIYRTVEHIKFVVFFLSALHF